MKVLLCFALSQILLCPLAQADNPYARFLNVTKWDLQYRYSGSNAYRWKDFHVIHNRSRWEETEIGGGSVPTTETDGQTYLGIYSKVPARSSLDYFKTILDGPLLETRYDRGNGPSEAPVAITLNVIDGTYDFSVGGGDFTATYGGTRPDHQYGPEEERTHVMLPSPAPASITLHLPKEGDMIQGSYSWEQEMAAKKKENPDFIQSDWATSSPTRGTVFWTLTPADELDAELEVEAIGYSDWMPENGNVIAIRATVVPKNTNGAALQAKYFTFTLAESSREKGVALNSPLVGANEDPDLTFELKTNPDSWKLIENGRAIRSPDALSRSTQAVVTSKDWGAYGSVVVTALLTNGRTVRGQLKNSNEKMLLLPKRDPHSKIAERWKQLHSFSGRDSEDEDVQPDNKHHGDGLTAYEEYRGLIANGTHTRRKAGLLPTRKDLVVVNTLGESGRKGLALFEKASSIHVVEVAPQELSESRQVNINRGGSSEHDQYGLFLKGENLGGVAGVNRPSTVFNKTPKLSKEVVIDIDHITSSYLEQAAVSQAAGVQMPYTLLEEINSTIAHEVAHGLGAPHHGEPTQYTGPRVIHAHMTDHDVYSGDGYKLQKPYTLKGAIGRPGNESSGDTLCIMAYNNFYNWAAVGPLGGPYNFYSVGTQPMGNRFCTAPEGTGMNQPRSLANGNKLPSYFGNAAAKWGDVPTGNCQGSMRVKDGD